MNRTIKDATVKRFHYESHDQLAAATSPTSSRRNFARGTKHSKASRHMSSSVSDGQKEPERYKLDPIHQMPRLALQLRFCFDVGSSCRGLMCSPPERPSDDV